jgi:hypothetical protein
VTSQTVPHAPQLLRSVAVSVQSVPPSAVGQEFCPALQTHAPAVHTLSLEQALPQSPQLLVVVMSVHVPPQDLVFPGHAQVALWHVMPPVQAVPHLPQLLGLLCTSTQMPLHESWPATGQFEQMPVTQF